MTSDVQRAAQRVAGVDRLIERARQGGTTREAEHRVALLRFLADGPRRSRDIRCALGLSAAYSGRILAGLVAEGRVRWTAYGTYELDPDHPDSTLA